MKNSEIKFSVTLDDENLPESIRWEAADSGVEGPKPAKSVMIALWNDRDEGTLRIDLWTKEMMIEEMQRFFYQSLVSMADTYRRSTHDEKTAETIRTFASQFGKATGVLA